MSAAKEIQNPNSSGQGFYPGFAPKHHDTLIAAGLTYSHTTPIAMLDGSTLHHHTYRLNRKFSVSVWLRGERWIWAGSVAASGSHYQGRGDASLAKYLKGAVRRHKLSS